MVFFGVTDPPPKMLIIFFVIVYMLVKLSTQLRVFAYARNLEGVDKKKSSFFIVWYHS